VDSLFGFSGMWEQGGDLNELRRYAQARFPAALTADAPSPSTGATACIAPHLASGDGLTVAIRGAPLWRSGDDGPASSPASRVLAAYRRAGATFLQELQGAFALVVMDHQAQKTLLAVDRMGIEALAFAATPRGIVFGSSCAAVAACPVVSGSLRSQALFDFLLLHMIPSPETAYEGVRKLEPGTCVTFADGRATTRRYWQPSFVEGPGGDVRELEAALHDSLRTAVGACRPDGATGAFLSGGLDSSTVAGVLGAVSQNPARTFSIGFGVDAYNELEFARIAARHFGFDAREYHVTPEDIVDAFPRIAAAYDEPFGNSSAVPTYVCARLAAQHGVNHLLAGDGGDELFGGNDRYARQRVFEHYQRVPQWLRRGVIEPLALTVDPESGLTPLRKMRSYVEQARITLPERFEYWNMLYRTDISVMLEPEFQASIDPRAAVRLMSEVYAVPECNSLLNRMLFYDWHFTLADNDLRKVNTMCELAGVKVSYPMLHPAVLDLSLRVPPSLKMAGSDLRTFYKQAMRSFLPREILEKRKHGFGLPFGVWLKTHAALGEMIFSLLTDLKSRRIIRAGFLDQLIREQRSGDASYFGYAIWDLAMLEGWIKAHPSLSPR
jgi:asparagine synthase (glutamine-hydrolysing)